MAKEKGGLEAAAEAIRAAGRVLAFTGAGVSRESGVPTFRGEGGLWERIDPGLLEISRFRRDPEASWGAIRELFYSVGADGRRPRPNAAHRVLAAWEEAGILACVVTQNIDGLHRGAGSRNVVEFHGSVDYLVCTRCGTRVPAGPAELAAGLLERLPPRCSAGSDGRPCGGLLKPDFVFFGEAIPSEAYEAAFQEAALADLCLVIGSTGVVYPAAEVPRAVKGRGGLVVEIDPGETEFSQSVTDIHLRLGAAEAMESLDAMLRHKSPTPLGEDKLAPLRRPLRSAPGRAR